MPADIVEDSDDLPKGRVKSPDIKDEEGESSKKNKPKPKPITPPPSPKWDYDTTSHSLVWGWKREKPVLLDTPVKDDSILDNLPFLPFHPNSTGFKLVDAKFKQELERRKELKEKISFNYGLANLPRPGPVKPAITQSGFQPQTKKRSEAYRFSGKQAPSEPNAHAQSSQTTKPQQRSSSRHDRKDRATQQPVTDFQSIGRPLVQVPTLTARQRIAYAADPLAHAPRPRRIIKEQAPCPVGTWLKKS